MSVESSMVTPPSASAVQLSQAGAAQQAGNNTAAVANESSTAQPSLSVEKLQAAVDRMNELMQNGQRSLNFSVDNSSEQVVVKVMDVQTKEVVRQIPSEETLKFAEYIEGMVGLLFDKEA